MHNSSIQQSRVSSEDLLADVLTRYEYPKQRLTRVYAPGVAPIYPNPFKYGFVATIYENGDCIIKALASDDNPKSDKRITLGDLRASYRHLSQFGSKVLRWLDDGKECAFYG